MTEPADRQPDGTPTDANPTLTIADFGAAPIGVPNFVIDQFTIPPFLLPIYQACGTQYGIPWQVLASINRIETAFGTNLNVSTAGALGWMQFMPSTWEMYGVDANNDGRKDPYNPVDAICAAARYLKAAGGEDDLRTAIFAYNHADWYVDEVLLYAQPVRQAPRRPGRLAHRPHRGRPLPGRRQRPLRRRHLRARGARALQARQGPGRQRRRRDLRLTHTSRDQHLLPRGRPGRRRQRRRHHRDRQVQEARPLHRPPRRLRQPLHLRPARRGLQGLPGAEAQRALRRRLQARQPDADDTAAGRARDRRQAGRGDSRRCRQGRASGPPTRPGRRRGDGQHRGLARAPLRLPRAQRTTPTAPTSPASSTRCSRRSCPATRPSRPTSRSVLHFDPKTMELQPLEEGSQGRPRAPCSAGSARPTSSPRTCTSRSARPAAAPRRSTRSRSSTAGSCSRRPRSTAPPARTRSRARRDISQVLLMSKDAARSSACSPTRARDLRLRPRGHPHRPDRPPGPGDARVPRRPRLPASRSPRSSAATRS